MLLFVGFQLEDILIQVCMCKMVQNHRMIGLVLLQEEIDCTYMILKEVLLLQLTTKLLPLDISKEFSIHPCIQAEQLEFKI